MPVPLLNYIEFGSGQPLVIVHGLFGSSRNWQSLAKRFAEHWHVIAVDLRNHGDSFHDLLMNYPSMAADIEHLLDELNIDSAHLLGHSMGGKVLMQLCHDSPQRVNKMVVADVAPVAYRHDYDHIIEPVMAMDIGRLERRKQAEDVLARSINDVGVRMFILQNLVFEAGQARWKLNWPVLKDSMKQLVGFPAIDDWRIDVPTLFLRGERSDYVNDDHWRLILKHFAQAKHASLDAGHWLHAEKPGEFYQEVSRFLEATK